MKIDYLNRFDEIAAFFNGDYRDPAAFDRQAAAVVDRVLDRGRLTEILREQNEDWGFGPKTKTQENIARLARPETCAVVTGQQVGLFSGPLYTVYKALTAVKLAESLSEKGRGKSDFVPVFWLASDDHDIAEVDHIKLLDGKNSIQEIRYLDYGKELKLPASQVVFSSEVSCCIERLDDLTPDTEFKSEVLSHLGQAYAPGRSFADACARWMARMFASSGLVLIDASDPRLKDLGKQVFLHEIAGSSPSSRQAIQSSRELERTGYAVQVPQHEGILNLFYAEGERRAVRFSDGGFQIKGMAESYPRDRLLALAEEKPHFFSPNVLLRPVYQDALLPTVAYVAGPGEIAYFAQMRGVYESFGLPMPIIYPRKTVILLEKKVEHVLTGFGLEIQDLNQDVEGLILKIVRDQVPAALDQALKTAASHLEQDLADIRRAAAAVEPTLERSVDSARGKILGQVRSLEKKILQATKRKDGLTADRIHKAKNSLFPQDHPQERTFNITPFLIKYGYAFMDRLNEAIVLDEYDHQIVRVSKKDG